MKNNIIFGIILGVTFLSILGILGFIYVEVKNGTDSNGVYNQEITEK